MNVEKLEAKLVKRREIKDLRKFVILFISIVNTLIYRSYEYGTGVTSDSCTQLTSSRYNLSL